MSETINLDKHEKLEDLINFLAAEYHMPKFQEWRLTGYHISKKHLQIDTEKMEEYPWIEWRSLWEWFDRKDPTSGKTFVEMIQAHGIEIPYSEMIPPILNSTIGVYQVVGIRDKDRITLEDLITFEKYEVIVDPIDLQLPWTILIGRLYPIGNGYWTGIQEWISYPPYFQLVIQEWLKKNKASLKENGLQLIYLATEPSQVTGEDFILIMEQFQEILIEDRGLFEKSLQQLPHEIQKYIMQTLQYTLWLSALQVEIEEMFFPWETQLGELGSVGNFTWNVNIKKQLIKNFESNFSLNDVKDGTDAEDDQLQDLDDSLDFSFVERGDKKVASDDGYEAGDIRQMSDREYQSYRGKIEMEIRTNQLSPHIIDLLDRVRSGDPLTPFERKLLEREMSKLDFKDHDQELTKHQEEVKTGVLPHGLSLFQLYLSMCEGEVNEYQDLQALHIEEFLSWWYLVNQVDTNKEESLAVINDVAGYVEWLDKEHGTSLMEASKSVLRELKITLPKAIAMKHAVAPILDHVNESQTSHGEWENWFQIKSVQGDQGILVDREDEMEFEVAWPLEMGSFLEEGFIIEGILKKDGTIFHLSRLFAIYPPQAWEYVR